MSSIDNSFPPVYPASRINERFDPVPRVKETASAVQRVYQDKVITDTETVVTYDNRATLQTVRNTAQTIDLLI